MFLREPQSPKNNRKNNRTNEMSPFKSVKPFKMADPDSTAWPIATSCPSTTCARARTRSTYPPLALPPELFPHPPSLQHKAEPAMYKLTTDVKRHRPRTAQDGPLTIDLTPHPYILHAQHINTYSGQLNDGLEP